MKSFILGIIFIGNNAIAGMSCYSTNSEDIIRFQVRAEYTNDNFSIDKNLSGFIYYIPKNSNMLQGSTSGKLSFRNTRLDDYTTYHLKGTIHDGRVPYDFKLYLYNSNRTGDDKFHGNIVLKSPFIQTKLNLICTELSRP